MVSGLLKETNLLKNDDIMRARMCVGTFGVIRIQDPNLTQRFSTILCKEIAEQLTRIIIITSFVCKNGQNVHIYRSQHLKCSNTSNVDYCKYYVIVCNKKRILE